MSTNIPRQREEGKSDANLSAQLPRGRGSTRAQLAACSRAEGMGKRSSALRGGAPVAAAPWLAGQAPPLEI
jgi:hypothetical protein